MTDTERQRRAFDLCDAALDRDEPERAAFVAAACGSDDALRQEVEALLAQAHRAEGFLAAPLGAVAADVLADTHGASLRGRQIGSHKILALLGAGGMGEVYRAHDTKLGRDVAIKVVADALLADPQRRAGLEREARVLARLNHPNIGAIYGLEEAEDFRGLVLELVEGATLAERLRLGPLPAHEALTVARQIAGALEAAHEKGVIHRDLKPANIKITPDGSVKVLDFGIAKVFARDGAASDLAPLPTMTVDVTREGVIAGTAAYMSPEQARGKAIDKRTDIWAFGCVLYELLTARRAFPGDTTSDTIAAILERQPDWSALPAQTPLSVRRLLQRCLEKDPQHRLRDIGDVRLEIEEALGDTASFDQAARQEAGRVRQPTAPRARHAWWAAAATSLLVVAGAATWQLQRSEYFWRNPLDGATITRLTDFEGAEHHAALSRDGRFVAFLCDRDGTWDAWAGQVGTGDFHNLTQGRVSELRNPGTRTVGFSPDGSLVTLWRRVPDSVAGGQVDAGWAVPTMGGAPQPYLKGVSELDWSPDGRRLVYHPAAAGDPLFVTEPDEKIGREIYVARPGLHNHFPLWSRDGAFIYFVHGFVHGLSLDESDIWRIRATGGQPERLTFHNARVTFPALLADGTLLYLATDPDGSGPWIYAMDVERRVPHRVSTGIEEYASLAASADGRRLVATVLRSTAGLWRVPIADQPVDESGATPVALPSARGLSPRIGRGYLIYRAPKAGTDRLVKLADGTSTELWSGVAGRALGGPALAPDGQRLAFLAQKRERTQLYVMNTDGSGARRVAEELDVRGAPAWSPDGQWLAIAVNRDGAPQLVKVPSGGGSPVQLVKEYAIDPVWAPSGQFLVYTGADVGTTFSVKAVSADGAPHPLPDLILTRGARRLAFRSEHALVVLKGDVSHKEFWLVDLETGGQRQLTHLGRGFSIGDFDVAADGSEIVFDRSREESDIVSFDLPAR